MSPSAWKLGLPLSVKVRSDIYKPLEEGGRGGRGGRLEFNFQIKKELPLPLDNILLYISGK